MAADWWRGVMGVEVVSIVRRSLGEIHRFGTLRDGEVAMVESLPAPLVVDGIADLQVVLLIEGHNHGQPQQDFESNPRGPSDP